MSLHASAISASAILICLVWAGIAMAPERPEKGQSAGRLEMSRQVRAENSDSLDVTANEALRHARKQPLMTPMQSTDAFLQLDRSHDMVLTRSERAKSMAILRAQFEKYDSDHNHRLTYSGSANYTDVVPSEIVQAAR
jgi:hypothetical protein